MNRELRLEAACKATVLFHSGGPWSNAKASAWVRIAALLLDDPFADATTKTLCDMQRKALEP